jgi:Pyruvate/2-oxoacid:ferredoxin oxidoreductase gamma subunit
LISIDSVEAAIRQKFPGPIGERNVTAARKAFEHVQAERGEPARA